MERLLSIGFVHTGDWKLGGKYGIEHHLENHREKNNLLYAFIIEDDVKYIGKTTKKLFQRMGFYRNPGGRQSTNIRVKENIITALRQKKSVNIFVFVDNGQLSHGGYHLNIAAGIEDSLISKIQPEWNLRGVDKTKETVEETISDEPDNDEQEALLSQQPAPIDSTTVTLGSSYYNKGFFNITKEKSEKVGSNSDNVEIQLGDSDKIMGYINRDSNKSGAPRIMGGMRLRDWIKANFRLNDEMKVDILSKQVIKIILNHKEF